ncbi:MAG: hypothetical protein BA863_12770 [Desulfovibrio sp. S3730MH75]|nr:MAG: hypothetical protein BA863_12770 [Desulfovibrio sp. S3730MH75]
MTQKSHTKQIILEKITKKYSSDIGRKSVALTDVSFSVNSGEIYGIIGPNGAGKSTALKILLGFVRPDSGTVKLSGLHPKHPSSHEHVGYLPESPCLYNNLTVTDHLAFAGRVAGYSKQQTRQRTTELLELTNLPHAAKKTIRNFSKGMTQRAALAYALFHQPKILILDEPMSGLDPVGRRLVIDIIHEYNQRGNTVLFCSHILTDVERICDRIGIMHQGQIKRTLDSDKLQGNTALESIFLQTVSASTQ